MRRLSCLSNEFQLECEKYDKSFRAAGAWILSHFSHSHSDLCAAVWYQRNDSLSQYWMEVYIWVGFEIILSVLFYYISNIMSALIGLQKNSFWFEQAVIFFFLTAPAYSLWCCVLSSGECWSLRSAGNPRVDVDAFPGSSGGKVLQRQCGVSSSIWVSAQVAARVLWTQWKSEPRPRPMALMTWWKIGECACQRSPPQPLLESFTAGFWFQSVCQLTQPFTHFLIMHPCYLNCPELFHLCSRRDTRLGEEPAAAAVWFIFLFWFKEFFDL